MKRQFSEVIERGRELIGPYATIHGAQHGRFRVRCATTNAELVVIAAGEEMWRREWPVEAVAGPPWEHVSVSCRDRCPTWQEMAWAKDQFFGPEECVVEYHPPKSRYVNAHPFVLHLWKAVGVEFPVPPLECV